MSTTVRQLAMVARLGKGLQSKKSASWWVFEVLQKGSVSHGHLRVCIKVSREFSSVIS